MNIIKNDLTGKRFGKLVVLGHEYRKGWKCLCDCGNIYYTNGFNLTKGRCSSCGCMRYEHNKCIIHPKRGNLIRHTEVIGKKFGKLTAIEHAGYKNNHETILCKCECGTEKVVDYYKLVSGHTTSCGNKFHKYKYDLTGKKFGRLSVIRPFFKEGSNGALWECKCDCGNVKNIPAQELLVGGTKSCGCLKIERNARDESKTRLYKIWENMKQRCLNKNVHAYKNYGGRGISICKQWMEYQTFKEWALENGYNDNLTIERINVNGNYCPENCKWITRGEQCLNKRLTLLYPYNGRLITLVELSKITGQTYDNLHYHYHNNDLSDWLSTKGINIT